MSILGTDVRDLHRQALDVFGTRVDGAPVDSWQQPTPCRGWDVGALVNHVVGENRWVPLLLGGATVAEVGETLDGDLLGDDPAVAWHDSAAIALDAIGIAALDQIVHLSFGDFPAEEYLCQLTADALVHAWDLARATGQPESLPADVVDGCARWFDSVEHVYRAAGAIGPAIETDGADSQATLLGRFGRNPSTDDPLAAVVRFNQATAAHDLEAIAATITDDCLFVDTTPPDGVEHRGRDAVLAAFGALFDSTPSASFTVEGGFVGDDRVTMQWRYDWQDGGGGHVRGVDVITVRSGRVAAKQAYVKG